MDNFENQVFEEVREEYKHGVTDSEEYIERFNQTENTPAPFNPFKDMVDEPEDHNPNRLDDLVSFIDDVTERFTLVHIERLRDIVLDIHPSFISESIAENILNKMPPITSISVDGNTFEVFQHITENEKVAKIVSEKQYFQAIQFREFEMLNNDVQSWISLLVYNLISADSNNIPIFYQNFFPYFYSYFVKSGSSYKSNNLPAHLRVADLFVNCCNEQEFNELFHTFLIFSFRTKSDSIGASLHGMCTCLAKQGDLVSEIKDQTFLTQLSYLATRKCIQEEVGARDVRQSALVIYEYIAYQGSTLCNETAYHSMFEILHKNFENDDVRSEAIYLFGFAVTNCFFVRFEDYSVLVEEFLKLFNDLTASVKKEWIITFANIIYFLPKSYVLGLFGRQDFLYLLEQSLWFDVPEVQKRLLTAVRYLLFHHTECCSIINSNEGIIEALEILADSDDVELQQRVESVLSILKQPQGE